MTPETISGRSGIPVRIVGHLQRETFFTGNESASAFAQRLNIRFARPIFALPSCRNSGKRLRRAASAGGNEAKLPMQSSAWHPYLRYAAFVCAAPAKRCLKNIGSLNGFFVSGTASIFTASIPYFAAVSACLTTCFPPRMRTGFPPRALSARAMLRPGLKCPPVPPQLMARVVSFIQFSNVESSLSQRMNFDCRILSLKYCRTAAG